MGDKLHCYLRPQGAGAKRGRVLACLAGSAPPAANIINPYSLLYRALGRNPRTLGRRRPRDDGPLFLAAERGRMGPISGWVKGQIRMDCSCGL